MTKIKILKADSQEDIDNLAKPFLDNGFKVVSKDDVHLIAKKRNFGNFLVHILFIFLILFVISYTSWLIYVFCIAYISYFVYFLYKKSEVVLITTETTDKEGKPVNFDNIKTH